MGQFNFVEVRQSEQQASLHEYTSVFKDGARKFRRNKMAMTGVVMFALLVILSIVFTFLPNYDVSTINSSDLSALPGFENTTPGDLSYGNVYWFGTDAFGRDLWSRTWGGIQYSLLLATITTTINIIFAVVIGLSMGYFDKFDKGFSFVIKVLYALPSIIILILFSVIFRTNDPFLSFWVIVISLVFSGWVNASQQIRGVSLKIRNLDFITASQTLGTRRFHILKTFFTYSLPVIVIQYTIIFPKMIIAEATLGFLGLSVPDIPTLGNLINDGKAEFLNHFYQLGIPLAALSITTVSIQFIGFGVEEALSQKDGR